MATVILKNRHSLQGLNLKQLIIKIRDGKLVDVDELASFQEGKSLADLSIEEFKTAFQDNLLSENTLDDVLQQAGRAVNLDNCRLAVNEAICFANEFGQSIDQQPASGSKDEVETEYQPPMTRSKLKRKIEDLEKSKKDCVQNKKLKTDLEMSTGTSLFEAIEKNDLLTVNYLIQSGTCDVNIQDYWGDTPLHEAIELGQMDMVRSLLAQTECDVNIQNSRGYTPLHLAILCSDKGEETVRCLLNHTTIDVNIQDIDDYTPLHRAVDRNEMGMVRCLLDRPECNVNIQDSRGHTPLHVAVNEGNLKMLKCILDETICPVYPQNNTGDALLHTAVMCDNIEMVRYLIDEIDTQNNDGDTPLHKAVQWSTIEIVRYLIDQTVFVNIPNYKGETLLHKAVWSNKIKNSRSITFDGCLSKIEVQRLNLECIKCILGRKECVVNIQNDNGNTPLHKAVEDGNIGIVRCLVDLPDCDVNIKNQGGYSPFSTTDGLLTLHKIAQYQNVKLCHVLFQHNVDVLTNHVDNQLQLVKVILTKNDFQSLWFFIQNGLYINSLTSSGENILHLLAMFYSYIDFSFLFDYGLDFNLINTDGNSPLMVASLLNNSPFIQFLSALHCDVNRQNHQGHTALHLCVIGFTLIKEKLNMMKVTSEVAELCAREYYPRYLACIDILLNLSADVNMQDVGGKTVLMLACMKNDRKLLERLLIHGADVNIVDNHGRSALQYIDLTNTVYDLTCFNLLLSHGCRQSFNQPCLNGNTIIQNVLQFTPLWQIDDIVNFTKFLVFKNVNLQLLTSDDGEISYGQLCLEEFSSESRQKLRQILYLSGGSFVQITQILHFEVEESYESSLPEPLREKPREKFYLFANNLSLKEMCRRVIRQNKGPAIHVPISEIRNIPILPSFLMFKDIDSERLSLPVKLESFIDDDYDDDYNSYDLNKENDDYENDYLVYIDCKYFNFEKRDGFTPLHRAVEEGNIAKVRYVIGLIHCDVNIQDHDDDTPLHIAVRDGDIDIARCLIEHTACNVNIQDSEGNTPLHLAVKDGSIDIVRCLLDQVDCNVNNQEHITGDTPLHIAAWGDDIEIVRCILANTDCDVNIQDSNGYTPLHSALLKNSAVEEGTIDNNTTIVRYLLEHISCIVDIPDSDFYRYTHKALEMGHTENIKCILQTALKFTLFWKIDETINFIKFLVFKNANLQRLTLNNPLTYYGQLSLEELSSKSRHELRQIMYLSGGSFVQITQILHFEVEETYAASLPEYFRETPREKFYLFANNLSLKEICRRLIRQNTGLEIHDRISEIIDTRIPNLTDFMMFKDNDSERFSLPVQLDSFIDNDYNNDYDDDYNNDYDDNYADEYDDAYDDEYADDYEI